jgi:hypothetical protein
MPSLDKFIVCVCGCTEHLIRLEQFNWEKDGKVVDCDVSMTVHLSHSLGFFRRIWVAIKYVFGAASKYGNFDEVLLDEAKAQEIIDFLQTYKETKAKMVGNDIK